MVILARITALGGELDFSKDDWPWVTLQREALQVFAGVLDEAHAALYEDYESLTDLGHAVDNLDSEMQRGIALYHESRELVPPDLGQSGKKKDLILFARFSSANRGLSAIIALLDFYIGLNKWIRIPRSTRQAEAMAIVPDIERDLTGWFLFTREAVWAKGPNNHLLSLKVATEMEGPSVRKFESLKAEVEGWGEFPGA